MDRAGKEALAATLRENFSKAKVAIFADYRGLSAPEADEFRRVVRSSNGEVKVIKNNIGRLLAKEGVLGEEAAEMMDRLVGPTMVAFSYDDPAAAAKTVKQFSTDHEALKIKESLLGKKLLQAADVVALAELPSREVLLAQLLSVMNGPARNFVGVLAAVPRNFVTALAQIEKKKSEA